MNRIALTNNLAVETATQVLWTALGTYRPDGSKGIRRLMAELRKIAPRGSTVFVDGAQNLWFDNSQGTSTVMFCAHLDAVHPRGKEGQIDLFWSQDGNHVHTGGKAVLGADDGAGVALLAGLLAANVPGVYLFSQAEETGGHGMSHAVAKHQDRVEGITKVIAFDRLGTSEICGAQSCGTLASTDFVKALAEGLGLGHTWGRGTYTDNQEWREIGSVLEIVNISVGYDANHTKAETLDFTYWEALLNACIALDWEALPAVGPAIEEDFRFDFSYSATDDVVDMEAIDLCNALGFGHFSPESDLILDALIRAYKAGKKASMKKADPFFSGR